MSAVILYLLLTAMIDDVEFNMTILIGAFFVDIILG